ncbi:hypothetical protein D4Q76_02820 [archaeon]|nr:MAG: hypothetical protein D4Q76_02820 [archaeon]
MEHVIELPESGYYKVVQILAGGLPHLPFNYIGHYHRDILRKFLEGRKIPFETIEIMGKNCPVSKGAEYEVVGMGELIRKDNKISFSGDSMDYSMGINPEHIEKCKPYFTDKTLEIIVK